MVMPFEYEILGSDEQTVYPIKVKALAVEGNSDIIELFITVFQPGQGEAMDNVKIAYSVEERTYTQMTELKDAGLYAPIILMLDETISDWKN